MHEHTVAQRSLEIRCEKRFSFAKLSWRNFELHRHRVPKVPSHNEESLCVEIANHQRRNFSEAA